MKKLLVDVMTFEVSPALVMESIDKNNGRLIITGIVQRANSLNQNKRKYPKHILTREAQKYMELVRGRRSLGELDHPDSSIINLSNVSHLVTDLRWVGDDLYGDVEVLSTPAGNILKELFKAGVAVGISSRGLGSTKDIGNDCVEVDEDYEILCWDMVSNPSTQGGFMKKLHEGAENKVKNTINKYQNIDRVAMEVLACMSNLERPNGKTN